MVDAFKYQGQELQLFEKAINWKKYFSKVLRPYISGRVLECGAGIGSTTNLLNINDLNTNEWVLLEPDREMADLLSAKIDEKLLPSNCTVQQATIYDLKISNRFDTIIYIDVLEHIENDKSEIEKAVSLLDRNGKLIILAPAFPAIYSNFDKAIGHHRRYTKRQLGSLIPESLKKLRLCYLDSLGFFLSLANKAMLKQSYPSAKQVILWDKYVIPVSKITDKLFNYSFGKSILGIWQKR
jgi:SAM-dependent methyltransferase